MSAYPDNIILIDIKRRGMLYLISFSNEFSVRATKRTIDKLSLIPGMEYSLDQFRQLRQILEEKYAYFTAESILARRAHSIGEFKLKLRRKDISENLIKSVVKDFCRRDLLDDITYGKMRAKSILNRKPAGRAYLVNDLQKKLIPREIAENVVNEIMVDVDEIEIAVELLKKKRVSLIKFDIETARRKAYTYLSRRAISYGASKNAFDKLFEKSEFKQGG